MRKTNLNLFINLITIVALIFLPYYLFEGKLYVGGDDTRLLYPYPLEYLKANAFFSWHNLSTLGINFSSQYLLPFLFILSILQKIINDVVLSYLAFSLPLILGLIYFRLIVKELFKSVSDKEAYLGSLFYILSPIIILDQLFIFLTTIWLLGLVPAIGYYYLKYLKSSKFSFIYKAVLLSFVLSLSIWSAPWLFGFIVPMLPCLLIFVAFHKRKEIILFVKRSVVFFFFIFLSQAFWLLGFLAPYLAQDKTSFAVKLISQDFFNTFVSTVEATAKGYTIYPLLNLFHRQIAFDFEWKLKSDFINVFDKIFPLNFIFIAILIVGVISYKKYLDLEERTKYLFILGSFLVSLYFFTVNIGPLKDLFLFLGRIPGFVMFRNFYDKFAPGYVFIYAILITIGLVLIRKKYPKKYILFNFLLFFVLLLNFSTVKSTVTSPLWTTNNVYKTMNIPKEYLDFMAEIKKKVPSTNTILSLPFGASLYTVIKDDLSNNVYVGVSPVKIFSGVNDISGSLSFNFTEEANKIDKIIIDRNYDELNKILYSHNINYIMVTKNIPNEVLKSYVFNYESLEKQDDAFLREIVERKVLTSQKGNYELYTAKQRNSLIKSENVVFKKINSVKYSLYFKNFKSAQDLTFLDSFHAGWKLFINNNPSSDFCGKVISKVNTTEECESGFRFYDFSEIFFLLANPVFDNSHSTENGSSNNWIIDPEFIKNNYDEVYYKNNKDGSIDIELTLYFIPQLYHYYGLIISLGLIVFGSGYLLYKKKYEN